MASNVRGDRGRAIRFDLLISEAVVLASPVRVPVGSSLKLPLPVIVRV